MNATDPHTRVATLHRRFAMVSRELGLSFSSCSSKEVHTASLNLPGALNAGNQNIVTVTIDSSKVTMVCADVFIRGEKLQDAWMQQAPLGQCDVLTTLAIHKATELAAKLGPAITAAREQNLIRAQSDELWRDLVETLISRTVAIANGQGLLCAFDDIEKATRNKQWRAMIGRVLRQGEPLLRLQVEAPCVYRVVSTNGAILEPRDEDAFFADVAGEVAKLAEFK